MDVFKIMTIKEIIDYINERMHPGSICPNNQSTDCLGECPIVLELDKGMYQANLSWWKTPPKPSVVKEWFVEIGMSSNKFIVNRTIHDEMNYIKDSVCEMGDTEIWEVTFFERSVEDDII